MEHTHVSSDERPEASGGESVSSDEREMHEITWRMERAKMSGAERPRGSVKLFIGQISDSMVEEDVQTLFEAHGPVWMTAIIRKKETGQHRGCAFVVYNERADALNAVEAMHNNLTLPNMNHRIQVKLADGETDLSEAAMPQEDEDRCKLFVGMLPKSVTEDDIRALFEPFGELTEIFLMKDSNVSKGCAFIRYASQECAVEAIRTMNNRTRITGSKANLVVKFADTRKQRDTKQKETGVQPREAQPQPRPSKNSRRTRNGAKTRRGNRGGKDRHPAEPTMPTMMYYNGSMYPMQGGQALQLPPQQMGHPNDPSTTYAFPSYQSSSLPAEDLTAIDYGVASQAYGMPQATYLSHYVHPSHDITEAENAYRNAASFGREYGREGPPGCNLFVYHLPSEFTDQDMFHLFKHAGAVVSCRVYIDRITCMSKGFGFVSYETADAATDAISMLNGYQIANKRLKVQLKKKKGVAVTSE